MTASNRIPHPFNQVTLQRVKLDRLLLIVKSLAGHDNFIRMAEAVPSGLLFLSTVNGSLRFERAANLSEFLCQNSLRENGSEEKKTSFFLPSFLSFFLLLLLFFFLRKNSSFENYLSPLYTN